jgi:hypothetical protein
MKNETNFNRFDDYLAKHLEDPEFTEAYAKAKVEADFALTTTRLRALRGLTQSEIPGVPQKMA